MLLTCAMRHAHTTARTTEVGPGVTHLSVGQRVAMEPGIPCRCCSLCKEGTYNLVSTNNYFMQHLNVCFTTGHMYFEQASSQLCCVSCQQRVLHYNVLQTNIIVLAIVILAITATQYC
jgi:threonine dehydrogenase-like Zn-dependent dehydrogenase